MKEVSEASALDSPDDSALDRAIDETAGAMTCGDADEAFTARVMTRVEQPARRPPAWWIAPLAAAAVAMLTLAVFWPGQRESPSHPSASATARVDLPAPSASTPPSVPNAPRAPHQQPSPRLDARKPQIAARPVDDSALTPLEIDPIAVSALSTDSIAVPPLDPIAPIVIAPIDQGDRP